MQRFSIIPLSLLLILFSLSGCETSTTPMSPGPAPMEIGIFSPIQLEPDTSLVYLEDYFPNGELPDSVWTDAPGYQLSLLSAQKQLQITEKPGEKKYAAFAPLHLDFNGHRYAIPMKGTLKERHTFRYDPGDKGAEKVQLAGEMTNWNPDNGPMELKDGVWQLEMRLNPGQYQYQIVVNGEWILDPANPVQVPNGIGGINSQLTVGNLNQAPRKHFQSIQQKDLSYSLKLEREGQSVNVFWQNQHLEVTAGSFTLPDGAQEMERSYLRLFFTDDRQVTDYLFPLEKGALVQESKQLLASDQHANILYFMLVDRFFNGSTDNDAPLKDDRVLPPANYHGGDLAGIKAKLESGYFEDLGINTLWISPLNQNPEGAFQEFPEPRRWFSGYHGYWPVSSSRVDHRFGSNQELKDLVDAAHQRDTKVILDFVANHVHEDHPLIQNHPDWKTQLDLPDGQKNIRIWDAQRLTTWFDTFLPSLDFSNPEVIETQVDSAIYWLNEFNLDGFRHDATKHIPLAFWRRLQQKIKLSVDRPLYQVGETFGSRDLIGSYVGSGMLDGQFDFNLYFDLRNIFTAEKGDAEQLVATVNASLSAYGHHSLMGNISGNHDMPRFIAYAGGALGPGVDAKEAAWRDKKIGVDDPVGYQRLKQLNAFLMMAPGIPVIYYGDEIGMSGADDPDNRRDMRFEGLSEQETSVRDNVKYLVETRKLNLSTIYGQTRCYALDKHVFVMVRQYLGEVTIFTLNLSPDRRNIDLSEIPDLAKLDILEMRVTTAKTLSPFKYLLPGYDFMILKATDPGAAETADSREEIATPY